MLLSEYIENLQALLSEQGDLEVYYAVDLEGSGYRPINWQPSVSIADLKQNQHYLEYLFPAFEFSGAESFARYISDWELDDMEEGGEIKIDTEKETLDLMGNFKKVAIVN